MPLRPFKSFLAFSAVPMSVACAVTVAVTVLICSAVVVAVAQAVLVTTVVLAQDAASCAKASRFWFVQAQVEATASDVVVELATFEVVSATLVIAGAEEAAACEVVSAALVLDGAELEPESESELEPEPDMVKSTQASYVWSMSGAFQYHWMTQSPAVAHSSPKSDGIVMLN